ATGSIEIDFRGSFGQSTTYTVFPSAADALGQYRDETSKDDAIAVLHRSSPVEQGIRAQIIEIYFGSGNETNGALVILAVDRNAVASTFVASSLTPSKVSPFPTLARAATPISLSALDYLSAALEHG